MSLKYDDQEHEDTNNLTKLREILELMDSFTKMGNVHSQMISEATGISELEVMILREIQMNHTLTPTMIIKNINLSPCQIQSALDSLMKKQLIVKVCDSSDEHAWGLSLSEDGDMLLVSSAVIRTKLAERFAHLPMWEQMQILSSLHLIAEIMKV